MIDSSQALLQFTLLLFSLILFYLIRTEWVEQQSQKQIEYLQQDYIQSYSTYNTQKVLLCQYFGHSIFWEDKSPQEKITDHKRRELTMKLPRIRVIKKRAVQTPSDVTLIQSHSGSTHSPHNIRNTISIEWKKSWKCHLQINQITVVTASAVIQIAGITQKPVGKPQTTLVCYHWDAYNLKIESIHHPFAHWGMENALSNIRSCHRHNIFTCTSPM